MLSKHIGIAAPEISNILGVNNHSIPRYSAESTAKKKAAIAKALTDEGQTKEKIEKFEVAFDELMAINVKLSGSSPVKAIIGAKPTGKGKAKPDGKESKADAMIAIKADMIAALDKENGGKITIDGLGIPKGIIPEGILETIFDPSKSLASDYKQRFSDRWRDSIAAALSALNQDDSKIEKFKQAFDNFIKESIERNKRSVDDGRDGPG